MMLNSTQLKLKLMLEFSQTTQVLAPSAIVHTFWNMGCFDNVSTKGVQPKEDRDYRENLKNMKYKSSVKRDMLGKTKDFIMRQSLVWSWKYYTPS